MELLLIFILIAALIAAILFAFRQYTRRTHDLEERNKRLTALRKLDEIMMSSYEDLYEVAQRVTDAVSFELKLDLGVLALIDEDKKVLRRVAMSSVPSSGQAKSLLPFKYENMEIPLETKQNLAVKAIDTSTRQITHSLYDVFVPVLTPEVSQKIQQTVGVNTSLIYPVKAREKVIGVMIISLARLDVSLKTYEEQTIGNLIDVVGIALDNALLYRKLKLTSSQLANANTRLKLVDKLKDDFVSIASHELRTPMTAIRSYAWMALNRSDVPLSEKLKRYLERTLVSTERLINLVNDMLNVSRIESGRIEILPESFDIQNLVGEVLIEIDAKAKEKNLHVESIKSQVPKVFADSNKVHQILLNLLGNSLKFTPAGGIIQISYFSDGQTIEISVTDNGVGIAEDDLPRLFQKFSRLDNSYIAASSTGGTGLGLFISKSLVELMKGKIWVRSDGVNKGTTFTFSLPVATAKLIEEAEKFHIKPVGQPRLLEPVAIQAYPNEPA